jgi:hypothetical protein
MSVVIFQVNDKRGKTFRGLAAGSERNGAAYGWGNRSLKACFFTDTEKNSTKAGSALTTRVYWYNFTPGQNRYNYLLFIMFTNAKRFLLEKGDLVLVILFSILPLFMQFPYRVNIFLSWEGAYRLYLGQMPYRDFGLPMGFGYWVVPAVFFKLFGPYLMSLIKAQVFLNIVAGLSFRALLRKMEVSPGVRLAAILTYCFSYILMNFWPWYNNSVILWQIVSLNLLMGFILNTQSRLRYLQLLAACFFLFWSFFTKQDGGALALVVAGVLVLFQAIHERKPLDLLFFILAYAAIALLVILPFVPHGFGYWFNHGQPPHTARLSVKDFSDTLLGESQWLKFYLLLIALLLLGRVRNWKQFVRNKREMLFLLLTLGIIMEAAIFQVTSYTPPDNNIFVHSFAIAYLLDGIARITATDFSKTRNLAVLLGCVLLFWSGSYWHYISRIADRVFPATPAALSAAAATGENVINRHTYMLNLDTTHYEDESSWINLPGSAAFGKMYLPPSTVAGIQRVKQLPLVSRPGKKILNMTELTPLEYELGCVPEKGNDYPLWYHLGVSLFNRQAASFCSRISRKEYDMVLFEYIPSLNNFYPFRVRDTLRQHYRLADTFFAPRRPTNGIIEVYLKE